MDRFHIIGSIIFFGSLGITAIIIVIVSVLKNASRQPRSYREKRGRDDQF